MPGDAMQIRICGPRPLLSLSHIPKGRAAEFASVDSGAGLVTGIAAGSAVLKANATIGGTTYGDTCAISKAAGSGGSSGNCDYVKLLSVSDVASGEYVLAANYALTCTVGGTSVNIYGNQYLVDSDGTSFNVSSDVPDPLSWVVLSGTNGTFRLTGSTNDDRGLIYQLGKYKRFGCYAASNPSNGSKTYFDVELFKKSEAAATSIVQGWVNSYLHMSDYTSNSGYCSDGGHHYYSAAKTALLALGNASILEFKSNSLFDPAQARYDAWAVANGDNAPCSANSANPGSAVSSPNDSKDAAPVLAFVIYLLALFAISYKKKKRSS